ncbi:MAG TPA: N-formylglutamate amidohydrolase [Ramlibacter sp.]|nr:N-formylglutamate amidohydrolase [Ramlibacter sp.]
MNERHDQGTPASDWVEVHAGRPELALPLVCDSPHSGTRYPQDYRHAVERRALRMGEDTHIERLWGHAPELGATLVQAHFPRTYIDPNRSLSDLEPSMIAGRWPGEEQPGARTLALGMGLVWRQTPTRLPIYDRLLSVNEVQRRIDTCWRPYHAALQQACDQAVERWGACWHLNLHSMPSNAYERLGLPGHRKLADFVLGDLKGRSCDPGFRNWVGQVIREHGYQVSINDPYEGQELVRAHGRPAEHRHSLQIEVNRALYMDEATREPHQGFERLRADIASMLVAIARFVRCRVREARNS